MPRISGMEVMVVRLFSKGLVFVLFIGASPAIAGCITIVADGSIGTNRAVNNCPYPVIGKFCYEQGTWLRCGSSAGGFKIAAGGSEIISKPQNHNGPFRWRTSECPLYDWNRGQCRFSDP